jgi:DNA-binding PadR family transcriptional regulator
MADRTNIIQIISQKPVFCQPFPARPKPYWVSVFDAVEGLSMSVRLGILAVLTLGQAYGHQIHGELEIRMNRTGQINVGQIYSTIVRLQNRGLVMTAGTTADGLPLYAVTESGRAAANAWLNFDDVAEADWAEMVGHVLMAASMPGRTARPVIEGYRARLEAIQAYSTRVDDYASPLAKLGALGDRELSAAGIRWLGQVSDALLMPGEISQDLDRLRPRRGRRPA